MSTQQSSTEPVKRLFLTIALKSLGGVDPTAAAVGTAARAGAVAPAPNVSPAVAPITNPVAAAVAAAATTMRRTRRGPVTFVFGKAFMAPPRFQGRHRSS